jgi:hypothetical protein
MGLLKNKSGFVSFGDYTYKLNLEKLKKVCLTASSEGGTKEVQIAQTYELDEMEDTLNLTQKIEHETKTFGNSQNDMIIYDIVKLLIISLLEKDNNNKEFEITFGTQIAINTLVEWGILERI